MFRQLFVIIASVFSLNNVYASFNNQSSSRCFEISVYNEKGEIIHSEKCLPSKMNQNITGQKQLSDEVHLTDYVACPACVACCMCSCYACPHLTIGITSCLALTGACGEFIVRAKRME